MDTRQRLREQRAAGWRSSGPPLGIGLALGFLLGMTSRFADGGGISVGVAAVLVAFGLGVVATCLVRWLTGRRREKPESQSTGQPV